jgi:lipopolysaccharide/colanic/teichoic acid biosynthesis glycosyltransferase
MTEERRASAPAQLVDGVEVDVRDSRRILIEVGEAYRHDPSLYEQFMKPAIDRIGGLALFLLTLPLLAACCAAVLVTMGPPALIRQQRVGRWGQVFTLYKIRTMKTDRRTSQVDFVGPERRLSHKRADDPRITPVGRFLRRWSLDELPQFINVMRGDMSLVGPRPEMVDIVAKYEPWQHARHSVKPGLTGSWQVGERGGRLLHECTDMDLDYISHMSLRIDLKLLVLTPLAALGLRRGF